MKAVLMLEDGKSFPGEALGSQGERIGKVIFNTAVVGYQEMTTDPANSGKILVLTYPLIGNYGCAPKFNESKEVWLSGLVLKEKSRIFSNWQAKESFDDFMNRHNLLTLTAVDTRTLAVHLRQKGELLGIISTQNFAAKELLAKISEFRKKLQVSLLPKISVAKPKRLGKTKSRAKKIVILDLGVTNSILRQLEALGLAVTIVPYNTSATEILRLKPGGLIISGGPEEDMGLEGVIPHVQTLISRLPILGISTGHQVLARALGAKTMKMRLGHHGVNYPLHNPASYKGEITTQNHSYTVDTDSLNKIKHIKITGFNLNDRTVEEFEGKKLKLMGVQYIPSSPGLGEVNSVFKRFLKMMSK